MQWHRKAAQPAFQSLLPLVLSWLFFFFSAGQWQSFRPPTPRTAPARRPVALCLCHNAKTDASRDKDLRETFAWNATFFVRGGRTRSALCARRLLYTLLYAALYRPAIALLCCSLCVSEWAATFYPFLPGMDKRETAQQQWPWEPPLKHTCLAKIKRARNRHKPT